MSQNPGNKTDELKRRIIFLDVDGVLNSNSISQNELESHCLQHLKYIVDSTGAEIVISSTWRKYDGDLAKLAAAFDLVGLPRWIDCTEVIRDAGKFDRVYEILSWLRGKHNEIDNWIALDDEANWGLYPHNFRVRGWIGLTREIAEDAVKFLKIPSDHFSSVQGKTCDMYHEFGVLPAILFNGRQIPINWPHGPLPSPLAEIRRRAAEVLDNDKR